MQPGTTFDPEIVRQLGRIDLIAKVIADGVQQGLHGSRRHGFSTEFSDFKQYSCGDDTRMLDWRLYARTDRLFIKRFEAETSMEITLILDSTRSMAWQWRDDTSKVQYGANLLAALAVLYLRQHDCVGLLTADEKQLHHVRPRARRSQLERIFACLEAVTPASINSLELLAESLAEVRHHTGVAVVCTDLEEDPDSLARALLTLSGLNDDIILLHLLDRHEIELPFDDATHLQDSESGKTIPVNLPRFRNEHVEGVQRFRSHWRSACQQHDIFYYAVDTGMNYVDVLLDFLHKLMIQTRCR